jgi:hypothetical protein
MAGYIGKGKSVVSLASYTKAQADAEFVSDPNSVITVSGSNVGIGVTPVSSWDTFTALQIEGSALGGLGDNNTILGSNLYHDNNAFKYIGSAAASLYQQRLGEHRWYGAASGTAGNTASLTQHMTLDSSGNLLVGTSNQNWQTEEGMRYFAGDSLVVTRSSATPFSVNRLTDDGDLAVFRKNGTTVGSIGTFQDDLTIGTGDTGFKFSDSGDGVMPFNVSTNAFRDGAIDLGHSSVRFEDIYATNGTIQTSDRNEKQDIEVLSDAETRVAQACKGLLRKFRWQDAVAEKGDDARIHFGIIAQDLQDAFAAEGLDAGRYAMFISSTWWETQTEVPAVEAVAEVLDDDGNVVTEAVEAKDAYTRTDTYETQAEAPEGATERTRLGVRYPELLAFIIGAM